MLDKCLFCRLFVLTIFFLPYKDCFFCPEYLSSYRMSSWRSERVVFGSDSRSGPLSILHRASSFVLGPGAPRVLFLRRTSQRLTLRPSTGTHPFRAASALPGALVTLGLFPADPQSISPPISDTGAQTRGVSDPIPSWPISASRCAVIPVLQYTKQTPPLWCHYFFSRRPPVGKFSARATLWAAVIRCFLFLHPESPVQNFSLYRRPRPLLS